MLRKLKDKDANFMLEWMHDPDIQKNFRRNMLNYRIENVKEFIKKAEIEPVNGRSIHFAVVDENDEYLGTVSLKDYDDQSKCAEYAISLRKKAQGRGIGKKATEDILKYAFETCGMSRVFLNVLAENQRAIKLYEKCGFVYEGTFRKHLFLNGRFVDLNWYGILREEYNKIHKSLM